MSFEPGYTLKHLVSSHPTEQKQLIHICPDYEQLFFEGFPASFQAFKAIFRYKYLNQFYKRRCSDKAAYYGKYISIALGAMQEHDTSGHSDYLPDYLKEHLYHKLFYNTEAVLSVLAKRSEADIANFFNHPKLSPHD